MAFIDGKVWIQCLSENPVFVQSLIANLTEGDVDRSAVFKIMPNTSQVIFDGLKFSGYLANSAYGGYESVYELMKLCSIRLSFVKGWGSSEYYRKEVTATPCWIEIKLNGPLKWIDNVLRELTPPNNITSHT